jgi:3,4-dihydroxy 2-butanone 4-phosphate synthase/GTP cyclohydrolase II
VSLRLDPVGKAVAETAAGRPIVVVDDENRENEGDLIMAAANMTPEQVAFMIRHTSGILCTPLPQAEARRLQLWPMVADNDAPLSTALTVSIDHRRGLATGISAEERCNTIRALGDPATMAGDFVRPAMSFP